MSEPSWERIEAVFGRLVALENEDQRRELLARESANEPQLRQRLEALLAADDGPDRVARAIETGWSALASDTSHEPGSADVGRRFGPWVVDRKLGEGGMSEVYLAARADDTFHKHVAFKLLKPGLESPELVRRFRTERRILASLEHPNIARLIDAGTTDDNRPYFVMELVDGEPIDRYCDERRLTIDERLALFLAVCSAVSHAHRNLVVHRDLKPSNILVTSDGVPKLLDFGIASLLNPDLLAQEGDRATPPSLALTPAYASPEQRAGRTATTTSDVFSLGILLCELLSGRRPDPIDAALDRPPTAPSAPSAPSALVTGHGEDGRTSEAAAARSTTLDRWRARLRGDLDAIVMTALRPEPQRRYASVELLATDIERHRASLPVAAHGGGFGYRLGRWVRRHPIGAAASVGGVVLGTLLIVALSVLSLRLSRQRDESARQLVRAERTADFFLDLFQGPETGRGLDQLTARQLLDRAAERVTGEWSGEDAERAVPMETIARVYQQLGLFEEATPLLEEAVALRKRALGPEAPEVATGLSALAILKAQRGAYPEAEVLFRQVLALRRKVLDRGHPALARSLNNLALVLDEQGDYAAAVPLYQEAFEITERQKGPDDPALVFFVHNLALLQINLGDYDEAERLCRDALERLRRQGKLDDLLTDQIRVDLGVAVAALGRREEGERQMRLALASLEARGGAGEPEVARALLRLAELARRGDDPHAAEPMLRRALTIRQERYEEDHPQVADIRVALGQTLVDSGELDAAEPLLTQALEAYRRAGLEQHPMVGDALVGLARLRLADGDVARATSQLTAALEIRQRGLPPQDARRREVEMLLAQARRLEPVETP